MNYFSKKFLVRIFFALKNITYNPMLINYFVDISVREALEKNNNNDSESSLYSKNGLFCKYSTNDHIF